jgi:di/tricarboxylate transporter
MPTVFGARASGFARFLVLFIFLFLACLSVSFFSTTLAHATGAIPIRLAMVKTQRLRDVQQLQRLLTITLAHS